MMGLWVKKISFEGVSGGLSLESPSDPPTCQKKGEKFCYIVN